MAEPKAPAKTEKSESAPGGSTRAEIDAFLKDVRALQPSGSGHGRLIFAMDATMSRQPSWDLALELQADMFKAVKAVGGLDVRDSKALGKMLIVSMDTKYTNQHGRVAAVLKSQVIFY